MHTHATAAPATPVAAQPRPPVVEADEAGKTFGSVVALDAVDLDVAEGEIVGIIGPSGAGKTTMIRLLLGLYKPSGGQVQVFGHSAARFSRVERERIGYLPQDFVLYDDLTVRENLSFAAGVYGLGWFVKRRRIPELLELVQLTEARDRKAANISGGMRRRLALACALVHEPDLLVLDEPTAGLDPVLRATTWDIFHSLQARGRALIVTTQYVTESEYCDRVYLINEGRLAAAGTPAELRRQALGGDVVDATIRELDRALVTALGELPFVRRVARLSEESVELVTDVAAEAIPQLTEAITAQGYQLALIEERRVSFDRIFVELVEQDGNGHEARA